MFHFAFHTGMVGSSNSLVFTKHELERAVKDTRFPNDFAISLTFEPISPMMVAQLQRQHQLDASSMTLMQSEQEIEADRRLWFRKSASATDGAICFFTQTDSMPISRVVMRGCSSCSSC
jgi:hypothetical protein